MKKKTGGGRFNLGEKYLYFFAGENWWHIQTHPYALIALNDVHDDLEKDKVLFNAVELRKWSVFLDSGVFSFASSYAQEHGTSIDVALALSPASIQGFDKHLQKYMDYVSRWGSKLWGYVEIDLGSAEEKTKTREDMEKQGIFPVPVFQPLSDDIKYFEYLTETYDRVCIGGIARVNSKARNGILTKLWDIKKKNNTWVHLLGYTPNDFCAAFPFESMDVSGWINSTRFGRLGAYSCLKSIGPLKPDFQPAVGHGCDPEKSKRGSGGGMVLSNHVHLMLARNFKQIMEKYAEYE